MKKSIPLLALLVLVAAIVASSVSPAFGNGSICDFERLDGTICSFIDNIGLGGV